MRFDNPLLRLSFAAALVVSTFACAPVTGPEKPKQLPPPLPAATVAPPTPAAQSTDAGATAGKTQSAGAAGAETKAEPSVQAEAELRVNPAVLTAFLAARQALIGGRLDDAERGFLALTKSNPELAGPHANLGIVYRQKKNLDESVKSLERAVQVNPRRAVYFNQLGIAYRMMGQFGKAREAYEQAIALDPDYTLALFNLAILYDVYLWDTRRALELYDRYLSLSPGGDEKVKKWASDLRNRSTPRSPAVRKEQS
jgi:tetratricopeptide (TPR) repeat protein